MKQSKLQLVLYWLSLLTLVSCVARKPSKSATLQLKYLDDYVIPKNLIVQGTEVGGLSGLDYDGTHFYAVCDIPSSPRIYKFSMALDHQKIDSIYFDRVIKIPHSTQKNKTQVWDSEGILYDAKHHHFTLSSEGSIQGHKDPFIAELDSMGNLISTYKIPEYFKATNPKGLRNNGAFEGLTRSADSMGIWVSTELPMKRDGPTVNLFKTKSPVRFTYYDHKSKRALKQFAYRLDRLRKVPFLPFGMNGVSAILEYKPGLFYVLERAFSAGHGRAGFRIRLYQVDAREATPTLTINSLRGKSKKEITPAKKKLLFDFNTIRHKLSGKVVDNLEGLSFGPKLANGHQSLLLIADNNFSSWTQELNQVILLEIIPK